MRSRAGARRATPSWSASRAGAPRATTTTATVARHASSRPRRSIGASCATTTFAAAAQVWRRGLAGDVVQLRLRRGFALRAAPRILGAAGGSTLAPSSSCKASDRRASGCLGPPESPVAAKPPAPAVS
eukprot:CAMPEP_0195111968 /NCGR_PEP_ID=MMETSP0448-20130528/97813_1 /TAXON_ID=66468 /ORGANISM="Heterocapsa triquestra, Strain CCMP 448" /LENGTH=127 /DNA_ID=CAMNT_0040148787 /DNA_START=58 /DNA_END=442 /DNA_ORIENTATION=-